MASVVAGRQARYPEVVVISLVVGVRTGHCPEIVVISTESGLITTMPGQRLADAGRTPVITQISG